MGSPIIQKYRQHLHFGKKKIIRRSHGNCLQIHSYLCLGIWGWNSRKFHDHVEVKMDTNIILEVESRKGRSQPCLEKVLWQLPRQTTGFLHCLYVVPTSPFYHLQMYSGGHLLFRSSLPLLPASVPILLFTNELQLEQKCLKGHCIVWSVTLVSEASVLALALTLITLWPWTSSSHLRVSTVNKKGLRIFLTMSDF